MKKEKQAIDVYSAPIPTHGQSDIEILELAISNYGHWSWIQEKLPKVIALEFIGVQLMTPPAKDGEPPSNIINLIFEEPVYVTFLKANKVDFPPNWIYLWKEDQYKRTFDLRNEASNDLAFNNKGLIKEILNNEEISKTNYFQASEKFDLFDCKETFVLFNGEAGIIIGADEFFIQDLKEKYHLDQVPEKSKRWWEYWEKYHGIKKTNDKFPEDPFCSTILPAKEVELLLEKIKKGEIPLPKDNDS